jgi:hypothetical protein
MTPSADDRMDKICESLFLLISGFQTLDAIGAFHDKNIRPYRRDLSFHEVTVFFTGVVACVQNPETSNVNEKHTSTQDMSSVIRCERNSRTWSDELMSRDGDDGR